MTVERKVLLLGLLMTGDAHGYRLMEVLEAHVGTSMGLTRPTAYRVLGEMERDGWLAARETREGKRPMKTIYSISEEGKRRFADLLRICLEQYSSPQFQSDIGLMFLDTLPAAEIVVLLTKRLEVIQQLSSIHEKMLEDHGGNSTIENQLNHLRLDRNHTQAQIEIYKQKGDA